MINRRTFIGLSAGLLASQIRAADPTADPFDAIKVAVDAAIASKEIPGAVVAFVHAHLIEVKSYGQRAILPQPELMTKDTIFDLASLTKPIATATAIMQLIDQKKLQLDDPVAKHWPAFAANDKAMITIEQLLLHTSGLIADNPITDYADGRDKAFERIANLKLLTAPGKQFRYSDVNFIVLGHLVERLSKQPLDDYTRQHIFNLFRLDDTGFRPDAKLRPRIAPTEPRDGMMLRGEVHDPRAAKLGGVAGHAGLFGTAKDLAVFADILMHGGKLLGSSLFSSKTWEMFLKPREVPGGKRALGWDVDTSFSAPRGDRFPKGTGFGHTGFTGTSMWMDPATKSAIIVLTNRVHPNGKGNATPVRKRVGTIIGKFLLDDRR